MRKLLLFFLFSAFFFTTKAQQSGEREPKLIELLNSYSAGFLYNTYGLIGSIADGFTAEAWPASQATDLLDAQKKLAENMSVQLEKMISEGAFEKEKDRNYMSSVSRLLRGLGMQAGLLTNLVNNKNRKTTEAYEKQRDQNWKDLSKLMGIKE